MLFIYLILLINNLISPYLKGDQFLNVINIILIINLSKGTLINRNNH